MEYSPFHIKKRAKCALVRTASPNISCKASIVIGNPQSASFSAILRFRSKRALSEMIQFLAERSIVPVKIETDDMDILTIVFSRKLNAGNDFYWFVLGSLKRLTETIYGVVIGQSESRKMIFHGMFYQLRWCQCSV